MNAGASGTQQSKPKSAAADPAYARPPLKPHKKVFVFLCVVFALWLVTLLVLFFTTVYPFRHSLTTTSPL